MKKLFLILSFMGIILFSSLLFSQNTYVFDLTSNSYSSGTSFYVNDNASNDLDVSSVWTFEAWVYADSYTSGNYPCIMDRRTVFSMYLIPGATGGDYAIRFVARNSSDYIIASVRCDDSGDSPQVMYLDTWYHVAVSRDASGNTRMFINGNLADTSTDSDFNLTASSNAINIGARYWGGYERFLDGALDEVRVSNTTRYTAPFTITVHSHPFEDDSNTLLLFHFDDNNGDDKTPNNYAQNYTFSVYGHNCSYPENYAEWDALNDELPLPVVLSQFTAKYQSGTLSLYWTTQSENGNLGWNIYRGENETAFQNNQTIKINSNLIPGAGTTTETTNYSYTDYFPVVANTTYWYWIESLNSSGMTEIYGPISLSVPPEGSDPGFIPDNQNYFITNFPNPSSGNTDINFYFKEPGFAKLSVYNLKGQKVITLFDGFIEREKSYTVHWDGKDIDGNDVSVGVYLYKLTKGSQVFIKKMIVSR
ncbi:MAG: hypothetical protein DRZ79_02625 [Candidatus Cloacimonadota bacterium]|nr:MAG: hypothetical protein DRZ79_02625 [Candidatus Cloacimonadota bacterium]